MRVRSVLGNQTASEASLNAMEDCLDAIGLGVAIQQTDVAGRIGILPCNMYEPSE